MLGAEHRDTLTSVNNLGGLPECAWRRCRGLAAPPAGAGEPRASVRCGASADAHRLERLNNLAACMKDLGDAAGALPLYRRVLESSVRVLGPGASDDQNTQKEFRNCDTSR